MAVREPSLLSVEPGVGVVVGGWMSWKSGMSRGDGASAARTRQNSRCACEVDWSNGVNDPASASSAVMSAGGVEPQAGMPNGVPSTVTLPLVTGDRENNAVRNAAYPVRVRHECSSQQEG